MLCIPSRYIFYNYSNAVATSNQDTKDENNKGNNTNNTEDSPKVALKTAEASDVMEMGDTDPAVV